jgi:hypothetical protein
MNTGIIIGIVLAILAKPMEMLWDYLFKNGNQLLRKYGKVVLYAVGLLTPIVSVDIAYYHEKGLTKVLVTTIALAIIITCLNAIIIVYGILREHLKEQIKFAKTITIDIIKLKAEISNLKGNK